MFNISNLEIQQTQDLAFQTERIERQKVPSRKLSCGAKVLHVNMVTGGRMFVSIPKDYDGPCSVLDISNSDDHKALAVLPDEKEARMVAFIAITPDGGYSEILVEATNEPVTYQSFVDWV